MKKRLLCLLICISMLFNFEVAVFANSFDISEQKFEILNEDTYANEDMYNQLKEVGFTDDEILELYQREADAKGIDFNLPDSLKEKKGIANVESKTEMGSIILLAGNGDVRYSTYRVNFDKVAYYLGWSGRGQKAVVFIMSSATKQMFTKGLIGVAGLSYVGVVIAVAGFIFDELAYRYDGVTLYVERRYSYDYIEDTAKWYITDVNYRLW